MKKSKADTGVKHLPTNFEGCLFGCQDWQELLELSPGSTNPGYNGKTFKNRIGGRVISYLDYGSGSNPGRARKYMGD